MENWKNVVGYEGSYEVSNSGNVRTCEGKETYTERHGKRKWKQRVLKLKTDKNGYKRVTLWLNGKPKDFLVHRLVALAFIPKIEGKDIINHLDCDSGNNYYKNLEWCDYHENLIHAFVNKLNTSPNEIKLIDKKTNKEHVFYSMATASYFMGKGHSYVSGLLKRGKNETKEYKIETKGRDFIMTNQTENEAVVTVDGVAEAPKRRRTVKPKVEKTAAQIIEELDTLQAEVDELKNALEEIAPNSVFYPVANELLQKKQEELTTAINTVYTI